MTDAPAPSWSEHLDQLEEWLRRAEDPAAQPPASEPEGQPTGDDLVRAKALLSAMAEREADLRRLQAEVTRASTYTEANTDT